MFSKKTKQQAKAPEQEERPVDLKALLQEAVDRNSSIGIVRLGYGGQDPVAQGRLLSWDEDGLVIEELQVIGRDIHFGPKTRVEAHVKCHDTMMLFEAEIKQIEQPTQLNERRIVRSLKLSKPQLLRQGDRRSSFRSSLTGAGDEIPVRMWFLDRYLEEGATAPEPKERKNTYFTDLLFSRRSEPAIPVDEEGNEIDPVDWPGVLSAVREEQPHAVGRLLDLTANGLGVLMFGIAKMQLDRFERVAMSFSLEDNEIELVVELRHAMDLRGSTCKAGFLILHPSAGNGNAHQRRVLEKVAIAIQRKQLQSRRAA